MPFVLVTVGLMMIVTGARDTHTQLAAQLRKDFIPFTNWVFAIGGVGALGYIPELRRFSHYFMALIIIGMVLSNKGFFARLSDAIKRGPVSPAGSAGAALPATSPSTGNKAAGTGGQDNTGAFGQQPASSGQAKFNTYLNYMLKNIFGG